MSGPILVLLRMLIIALLYAFLAWALITLWRDLRRQSSNLAARRIPRLSLYSESEQEVDPLDFSVSEVIIGRDPACDLPLEDQTVSYRHARLVFRQEQWWIEDLRSTNSTLLNQVKVDTPTVLANGDRIQFGQREFLITIEDVNQADSSKK